MTTAEAYVTAAFLVVLAVVLLWLVIYAFKMRRLEQEVRELEAAAPAAGDEPVGAPKVVAANGSDSADTDTSAEEPAPHTVEPAR